MAWESAFVECIWTGSRPLPGFLPLLAWNVSIGSWGERSSWMSVRAWCHVTSSLQGGKLSMRERSMFIIFLVHTFNSLVMFMLVGGGIPYIRVCSHTGGRPSERAGSETRVVANLGTSGSFSSSRWTSCCHETKKLLEYHSETRQTGWSCNMG